jgi:hypothetical protein
VLTGVTSRWRAGRIRYSGWLAGAVGDNIEAARARENRD